LNAGLNATKGVSVVDKVNIVNLLRERARSVVC
jgi:hypothetical protein